MRPIQELPIEDLWRFVCLQFGEDRLLWALLRLDVAQFLELQRLAQAEGKILAGPTWQPNPNYPSNYRRYDRPGDWLAMAGSEYDLPENWPAPEVAEGDKVIVFLPCNGRLSEPPRPRSGSPGRRGSSLTTCCDATSRSTRASPTPPGRECSRRPSDWSMPHCVATRSPVGSAP